MNSKNTREQFYEQQLFEAKSALFSATKVKEIKFLQTKIKYLEQRMNQRAIQR